MCGIAAVFSLSSALPPVDPAELGRMCDRLAPRGPDGSGTWLDPRGRVGLGHRRLAIIDLSPTGAQPMSDPRGRFRIVFNGEIYNYLELRRELEATGHQFRSHSDTEVILALYETHGWDFLPRLRGMFTFVLWDENRRGLLLARDGYGIKPLYLSEANGTLRVASTVKALLSTGEVSTEPSPAGHAGFFLWGHVPEPYTLYRDVRSLPAGTALWVDSDGKREEKTYFDLRREFLTAEAGAAPVGNLREALQDSVRAHLVADVPVGVFLSAGLDSSALVALATQAGATELQTVTLAFREFRGTARDEAPMAEATARRFGTRHQTIEISRDEFEAEVEQLLDAMDQPTVDGVNVFFVSRAAARVGLKVALTGLGGDELLGGYDNFRAVPRITRAVTLAGRVPGATALARKLGTVAAGWRASPKLAQVVDLGGTHAGAYLLKRALYLPAEIEARVGRELARRGLEELRTLDRIDACVEGIHSPFLRVSALESSWYMKAQLLRDADWASMAHSLELRVPFVDPPLGRATAALAIRDGGMIKSRALAEAVPELPDEVLRRPKTGFQIPVRDWVGARLGAVEPSMRSWAQVVYQRFAQSQGLA